MIEIYEGRLGGGKTYSAVVRILNHLRLGGTVCTNVEVKWQPMKDYVAKRFGLDLEDTQLIKLADDQIGDFHRHTPSGTHDMPVLVVVDEAHLNFNSRDWQNSSRDLLAFLTQSRKVATDIIFISQSLLNMDKQFARLVQFVWRFRDLSRWKIPGLGIAYPFQQILACQFDYDGHTMLQRSFIAKDKAIFGLYETNSLLREFPRLEGAITKRKLNKTEKPKHSKMAKILIPLGLVLGIVCILFLKDKIGNFGKPSTTVQTTESSTSTSTLRASVAPRVGTPEGDHRLYDIYEEQFRGWYGAEHSLHTDGGWYQAGEMSSKGFVSAVSDRRARINQPDGRTGWVVSRMTPDIVLSSTPPPLATPPPSATPQVQIVTKTETVQQPFTPSTPIPSSTPYFQRLMNGRVRGGVPLNEINKLPH